jgi:hypothetical protein
MRWGVSALLIALGWVVGAGAGVGLLHAQTTSDSVATAPAATALAATAGPESPSTVWSGAPGVVLTADPSGDEISLDLFTRLTVIERDERGVRVVCAVCEPEARGYLSGDSLVSEVLPPEIAAWGTLPEFLLAIRAAAINRDFAALRPAMATDFTYAFVGIQSPDGAFAFWEAENYWSIDELADLLDQGVRTADGRIWAAPPAFVSDLGYHGPRAGFRQRPDGSWEWLYLMRDVNDRQ